LKLLVTPNAKFWGVASKLITLTLLFLQASCLDQPIVPTSHISGTIKTACIEPKWDRLSLFLNYVIVCNMSYFSQPPVNHFMPTLKLPVGIGFLQVEMGAKFRSSINILVLNI
jgi:hypothetical protein